MKRTPMIWLCLVTIFTMGAIAAGSATAALPEFKVCAKAVPKNTGQWNNKLCNELNPGHVGKWELFEWKAAKKFTFKGKDIAVFKASVVNPLVTPAENRGTVECQKEKVTGEVIGPKEEKWRTTWTKCAVGASVCTTPGAKNGEIKSQELEGTLLYLDAAKTKVGELIKAKAGTLVAQYVCAGLATLEPFTPLGGLLVERTGDINVISKVFWLTAASGPLNMQLPMYEEEKGTEAQGKEAWIWLACVNETQRTTGKTRAESEVACTVALGAPLMPVNTMWVLVNQPGFFGSLPMTQVSETESKGEALMVEA